MMGLTFWVIGEIIQSSSYSFGQFIAGRAIAGFGMTTLSPKQWPTEQLIE